MGIEALDKFKSKLPKFSTPYVLAIILALLCIFFVSFYSIDPDFGWHLKAGQYYMEFGIPKNDVFSYTASQFHWINHEWLNDILVANLYAVGGYLLIAIFFSVVWVLAFVIASRKYLAVALLFSVFSILPFAGIRPVAWTVLFVAILERIINSKNSKAFYFLPILFVFWANFHGSFVLGLLLLVLWQIFSKKRMPWAPVLLCIPAVMINPYGPWVFEEVIRTAADSKLRFRIAEWQMIMLPILSTIYLVIFSSLFLALTDKPLKKVFSIPGLLFAMTISSIRHFPVFVATSVRYMEDYFIELPKKIKWSKLTNKRVLVLSAIVCLPIIVLVYNVTIHFRNLQTSINGYPIEAVKYLQANGCKGNIYNSYNYGGYLIWQLPQTKTYIDGRMPSWKSGEVDYFDNYIKVFAKDEFRRDEFAKYNIKCVLLNSSDSKYSVGRAVPFNEQLVREGWVKVMEASTINYSLFIDNRP